MPRGPKAKSIAQSFNAATAFLLRKPISFLFVWNARTCAMHCKQERRLPSHKIKSGFRRSFFVPVFG